MSQDFLKKCSNTFLKNLTHTPTFQEADDICKLNYNLTCTHKKIDYNNICNYQQITIHDAKDLK